MSAAVNQLRMFAQALVTVCDEHDALTKHAVEQDKTINALLSEIERLKKDQPTPCTQEGCLLCRPENSVLAKGTEATKDV